MFNIGDKVRTIVHGQHGTRTDIRGEVVGVLSEWQDIKTDFIRVKFMGKGGGQHFAVFFASAFELDQ